MAKFRYWLPDRDGSQDDAYEVDTGATHARDIAADAARDYHHNHDGWEARWPLSITVELQNGTPRTFEVDREMEPIFYAVEIGAQGKTGDDRG